MRFVRHSIRGEWGTGVVAADRGDKLDVLFEGVGYKQLAKAGGKLVDIDDSDVPTDSLLRSREDWPQVERNAQREMAKRMLPERFGEFVEEFLTRFPKGLRDPECEAMERDYKVKASEFARRELEPEVLRKLDAEAQHEEILRRCLRCIGKVNLAFPQEVMKLKDIPDHAKPDVARALVDLVTAGERTPHALEHLATLLAPHGAAKWPVCSLLPFLLEPERWPYVKPTFIERTVSATGIDVEYSPQPNARTYSLIRDLYEQIAILLKDRGLNPLDYIDVQTFLWVASGMAAEAHGEAIPKP